jgi:hypothetical protein
MSAGMRGSGWEGGRVREDKRRRGRESNSREEWLCLRYVSRNSRSCNQQKNLRRFIRVQNLFLFLSFSLSLSLSLSLSPPLSVSPGHPPPQLLSPSISLSLTLSLSLSLSLCLFIAQEFSSFLSAYKINSENK